MSDLVDRLRGIYTCEVDDGAGLLNGKDTFTRTFPASALPPVHAEAANEIERLEAAVAELSVSLNAANAGWRAEIDRRKIPAVYVTDRIEHPTCIWIAGRKIVARLVDGKPTLEVAFMPDYNFDALNRTEAPK